MERDGRVITSLLVEESGWERVVRVWARAVAWAIAGGSSVVAGACLADVGNVAVYCVYAVGACVVIQVAWRR